MYIRIKSVTVSLEIEGKQDETTKDSKEYYKPFE